MPPLAIPLNFAVDSYLVMPQIAATTHDKIAKAVAPSKTESWTIHVAIEVLVIPVRSLSMTLSVLIFHSKPHHLFNSRAALTP